ncbi:DUF4439 domain-containing protein [Devriesea agamarum]|uniref:DUF4439 domain-containing protein n=1 Tax=Devriesea agamarum TaxID=472569 RepID=UPI00155F112D|nr:DUF4439 domain-containing protein [Devriesea agamarum]
MPHRSVHRGPAATPAHAASPLSRRYLVKRTVTLGLFGLGIAGSSLVGLSACGLRIGQPASYTPPAPGIDELFRNKMLGLVSALDDATGPNGSKIKTVAPAQGVLSALSSALSVQRGALLTGAETERVKAGQKVTGTTPSPGIASGPDGVLEALVRIRDLAADGAQVCSGSLTRLLVSIGAFHTWAATAFGRHIGATVPPARPASALRPTEPVKAHDVVSIGTQEQYAAALRTVQRSRWEAAYAMEVLAARPSQAPSRGAWVRAAAEHRTQAVELGKQLAGLGQAPVTQEPAYRLPSQPLNAADEAALPRLIAENLLSGYVELAAAAPLSARAVPTATALAQGEKLGSLTDTLAPLPGVTV